MTILYEGFDGRLSMPILGWTIIGLGILMFIIFICFLIKKDTEGIGALIGVGIVLVIGGLVIISDTRIPIIKATINEEVSWQEINDKYELAKQEGQIYTFKVKNTTIEEWENHLKEKESK
jgi:hypothetical protein